MRVIFTAANDIISGRHLKIEYVSFISTNTIGDLLDKVFGVPRFAAPFGQQIIGEVTSIGVVFGFEFTRLLEKSARILHGPTLILSDQLHSDVPFRAFGGKGGSFFENSVGFNRAFRK